MYVESSAGKHEHEIDFAASAPGFETLRRGMYTSEETTRPSLIPNPAYEQYLRMHKVFVGNATVPCLRTIHESLRDELSPRYLAVAGWAAVEAAIIDMGADTSQRLALINDAEHCWEKSIQQQLGYNQTSKNHLLDHAAPYRSALDIAVLPLIRGMIAGDITRVTCERAFHDCLTIAEANEVQLRLAVNAGDIEAVAEHVGFGYECNALLSINRLMSPTWFVIPALARADTGYYHDKQTHDLLAIRQRWGDIRSIIPIEVKSKASLRDRQRYMALLVRGKMHLSAEGYHKPGDTLQAIAAVYAGSATCREEEVVEHTSSRLMKMLEDYYFGERVGVAALGGSHTVFRDNARVVARHPGLSASVG